MIKYYYLRDLDCFAKGDGANNFIFQNGEWQPDTQNSVFDRLMGYDPYEEADSPYKIGNLSVMDQIETITEEEFYRRLQQMK